MGMFDYVRCEMPLPETPEPPPNGEFQSKDTPEQYLARYVITADGRLVWESSDGPQEVADFHGDIGFGTISLHHGRFTGGDWRYRARFTEGVCTKVELMDFRPTDQEMVAAIKREEATE